MKLVTLEIEGTIGSAVAATQLFKNDKTAIVIPGSWLQPVIVLNAQECDAIACQELLAEQSIKSRIIRT